MPIFRRLEVENGLSYQHLEVDFDQQGLVLVDGPVGAGKSSVFDILTHVLYGVTAKPDVNGPGIMNRYVTNKAGKPYGYRGVVEFENAGHAYRVEQLRSHTPQPNYPSLASGTGLLFTQDGVNINVKTNRSESLDTQKLVAAKTGMSVREFYGGVYLAQGYTHDLVTGKPKARQEYLLRYFGIDLFDRMIPEVKDRVAALAEDADLKAHEARLATLDAEAAQYGTVESLTDIVTSLTAEGDALAATVVTLDGDYLALQVAYSAWSKYLEAQQAVEAHPLHPMLNDDARTEYDSLRVQDEKLRMAQEAATKAGVLRASLVGLKKLDDIVVAQQLLDDTKQAVTVATKEAPLRAKVEQLRTKLTDEVTWNDSLDQKLASNKAKQATIQDYAAVLKSELDRLSKLNDVCFTCLRPVTPEEKAAWIADRQTTLAGFTGVLTKVTNMVTTLEEMRESYLTNKRLVEQIETLEASLTDAAVDIDMTVAQRQIKQLSADIADHMRYVDLENKLARLGASALDDDEIITMRTRWAARIKSLGAYLNLLTAVGTGPTPECVDEDTLRGLHLDLQEARTAYQDVRDGLTRSRQTLAMLERVQRQRAQVEADMASMADTIRRHRILQTLHVSLKALRGIKLHDATKKLVSVLPMYLTTLFQGEDIRVDVEDAEDSSDLVFIKNGTAIPLEGLSGGQQRKLGLAILFAFTQIANRNSNILVLDEPYTNLDPRSRAACYDILRDLLGPERKNTSLSSIFVMSHEQDLKLQRFDQRWSVKTDGRISTLVK